MFKEKIDQIPSTGHGPDDYDWPIDDAGAIGGEWSAPTSAAAATEQPPADGVPAALQ